MAVYRRGGVWWYEFVFAGQRIRESAKTSRKTLAIEAEKQHRLRLERALAGMPTEAPLRRVETVSTLIHLYKSAFAVNHRPKSVAWVNERSKHLERLCGSTLRADLTENAAREYMRKRLNEGAGNRTVNMELDILARAIGHEWRQVWPKLVRLEEPKDTGCALAPDEERRILSAAAKNKSPLIGPFVQVALLTAMRSDEIRTLQWAQVDLSRLVMTVTKAKTEKGTRREIPINDELLAVLSQHATWYEAHFGKVRPEWFVFPFSSRVRPVDPTRPVTTVKTAWQSVRDAAGVKCRLHDLRHTTLTKMAETDAPESTMLAIAGHMSRAMLERYSHIRLKAKRAAMARVTLAGEHGTSPHKTPHNP
jgi:integrase